MTKRNDLDFNPASWMVQFIEEPFVLHKMTNVFSKPADVTELQQELYSLHYSHTMNDIFSLSQTKDFATFKRKRNLPMVQKFLEFLHYFREFLCKNLQIELNDKISVSSSKYSNQDYLLCHDDMCEDRCLAFIFYLNPLWKAEWGGSLDIFDHDDDGQPSNVVHSIYPEFNSLIFFEVGNHTYHQVAEVVSSEASRITINGWFHSKKVLSLKPLSFREPPIRFMETSPQGAALLVHHFANNIFLYEKYTSLIEETIQADDVIMLQDFLKPHIFEAISYELCSPSVRWKTKGPANRKKYDIAEHDSLPPMTTAFLNFVQSKYMCSYLEAVTGYSLFEKNKKNADYVGLVSTEIQFWKSGCYSLLSDCDVNYDEATLDMWLFFNVQEEKEIECDRNGDTQPGNIYYYEKEATCVTCDIEPKNNSICLVFKNKYITTFVAYINAKSSLQYHAMRISFKVLDTPVDTRPL